MNAETYFFGDDPVGAPALWRRDNPDAKPVLLLESWRVSEEVWAVLAIGVKATNGYINGVA